MSKWLNAEKQHWHDCYMDRLQVMGALTIEQAEDALEAGMGDYDYDMNPLDAADDEISYWGD